MEQTPEFGRVEIAARGTEHPQLKVVLHLVEPVLEMTDLGGQPSIGQYQGAVSQAHSHLGQVLHLHQYVDRPVQVGKGYVVFGPGRLPHRSGS